MLEYVSGHLPIIPAAKHHFKQTLAKRHSYCGKKGIKYAHLVAPDKHVVLHRHFPYEIRQHVGREFLDHCGDFMIYPAERMSQLATSPYWKTDTHWNLEGLIHFVSEILLSLGIFDQASKEHLSSLAKTAERLSGFCGDLGVKLDHRPTEDGWIYSEREHVVSLSSRTIGNNGSMKILLNKDLTEKRIVVFGDSFVYWTLPILAESFSEVLFIRTSYFHREICEMFKPDFAVSQNAERYLPNMSTDEKAPLALLFAGTLGKREDPAPEFYRTLNALLQYGSPVYDDFKSRFREGKEP